MREERDLVELQVELERSLGLHREAVLREERYRVGSGELEALALHVHDRDGVEERVEAVRSFLEDSVRHALRALSDEKARASRGVCAFGKDV